MERRDCSVCGQPIVKGRLDALPNTTTCVSCSCSWVRPRTADDAGCDSSDREDMIHAAQMPYAEPR